MRKFIILCLLALSFSAQASELPRQIVLKTPTQSFTHEYDVAIHEGKIWYRPRDLNTQGNHEWQLLGQNGLPDTNAPPLPGLGSFSSPASVTQISADGDNLIAIGNDGLVYYMKWSTRKWTNKWGQPFSEKLPLPENIRSWAISHRGEFAGGYHDIDGNFHPVSFGVSSLYILSEDGLKISYADPWLPADFSSEICAPQRNRYRARALAASASTMFVINDAGEMYTRLADFDTLGHNPFLSYSYERKTRDIPEEKDVRTLPAEDWIKQPSIDPLQGRITTAITILQTGKGNNSRELRVEGVNAQGVHGYFSKQINDTVWQFNQTDLPLQKPLISLSGSSEDAGPDIDRTVPAKLRAGKLWARQDYKVELHDFNPPCQRATLIVFLEGERIEFPLFITATSQTSRKTKGAILAPRENKPTTQKNRALDKFMQKVFDGRSFAPIKLTIDDRGACLLKIR